MSRKVMSMGLITAAALMPAKPVPRPAPMPAKKVTTRTNNHSILFVSFHDLIQIVAHLFHHPLEILPGSLVHVPEDILEESVLEFSSPLDDRPGLGRTHQHSLTSVSWKVTPVQVPLLHQPVHVHGHQVGLQPPQLHNILGRIVARIVGQEHQDVEGGLGHMELPAQGLAADAVGLEEIVGKFYTDSFQHKYFLSEYFKFEYFIGKP